MARGDKIVTGTARDFLFDIARGAYPEYTLVHISGHNDILGNTVETMWNHNGLMPYPSAPTTFTISSSDANDTAAGSGARTGHVVGLDANWDEVEVPFVLNGQTGVTLATDLIRIGKIWIDTAGASGFNEGDVYIGTGAITVGVPAVVYGKVDIDHNISSTATYSVPAGYTAYVVNSSFGSDSVKEYRIRFLFRPFEGLFYLIHHLHTRESIPDFPIAGAYVMPEKSDLEIRAKVETGTSRAHAQYDIVLARNAPEVI